MEDQAQKRSLLVRLGSFFYAGGFCDPHPPHPTSPRGRAAGMLYREVLVRPHVAGAGGADGADDDFGALQGDGFFAEAQAVAAFGEDVAGADADGDVGGGSSDFDGRAADFGGAGGDLGGFSMPG